MAATKPSTKVADYFYYGYFSFTDRQPTYAVAAPASNPELYRRPHRTTALLHTQND